MSAQIYVPRSAEPLLEVKNLSIEFSVPTPGGARTRLKVKAVSELDLEIQRGETLGLVGESGCGKSTTGRALLRLIPASHGSVVFQGDDLMKLSRSEMRSRRQSMQIVFQDPYASLNPRKSVGALISEPLALHLNLNNNEMRDRVLEMMDRVGLNSEWYERYPHEFSGGQRQRIAIARALIIEPDFLVLDEPVSALDVSVQAQTINLLESLQQQLGLTYLFIAHDLAVVRHLSSRVAVMYLGRIVEIGDRDDIYENPLHPYTKALLSAAPVPDPAVEKQRDRIILKGDVPSPINPPSGCAFRTRCPIAQPICAEMMPALEQGSNGNQRVACHFA